MSRIGKLPVPVPKGVDVQVQGDLVSAKGPLGTLSRRVVGVQVELDDGSLVVKPDPAHPKSPAMWGLMRTLLSNLVVGVSQGFTKTLIISGIGYKAEATQNGLTLHLGYSNPVDVTLPDGVEAKVEGRQDKIILKSADKELLGDVAARIRKLRPVEPYRGKGIRYEGEKGIRKEGKTGVGG